MRKEYGRRRRTRARGHPAQPPDPRPYDVTMQVLVVHRRDGGGAAGRGGPLRASVPLFCAFYTFCTFKIQDVSCFK
jgi:hypothetical protein